MLVTIYQPKCCNENEYFPEGYEPWLAIRDPEYPMNPYFLVSVLDMLTRENMLPFPTRCVLFGFTEASALLFFLLFN